ncbi:hypothetical protein Cni_G14631 [Canna indica]|uniref:RRM domain-containing protein n=1 Tax=Canna indica TaxID=4628 RepID=A0AAQ3KEI8_9LILI|nr:hypothetical protein Cni_G14631 [Canna indica]
MVDSPRTREHYRSGSLPRSRSRGQSQSRSQSPINRTRSRSRSRDRARTDAVNPGNTLYVTGLSSRVTERDLEIHFSREGKVAKCNLIVEPRTRISRGFAFVTMDTVENADRCIKYLNQSVLEGRYITVEKSRRKRARTPTPGSYIGLKNPRDTIHYDRGRHHGGYSHDNYGGGYHRSPRHSPYRGGRDYSPPRYGGSRRDRSRSPDRGYTRRSNGYTR